MYEIPMLPFENAFKSLNQFTGGWLRRAKEVILQVEVDNVKRKRANQRRAFAQLPLSASDRGGIIRGVRRM
jgi:hypothetical protein